MRMGDVNPSIGSLPNRLPPVQGSAPPCTPGRQETGRTAWGRGKRRKRPARPGLRNNDRAGRSSFVETVPRTHTSGRGPDAPRPLHQLPWFPREAEKPRVRAAPLSRSATAPPKGEHLEERGADRSSPSGGGGPEGRRGPSPAPEATPNTPTDRGHKKGRPFRSGLSREPRADLSRTACRPGRWRPASAGGSWPSRPGSPRSAGRPGSRRRRRRCASRSS